MGLNKMIWYRSIPRTGFIQVTCTGIDPWTIIDSCFSIQWLFLDNSFTESYFQTIIHHLIK